MGAGPFLLDSYTPEGKAVFKKNPNYFEKNKIKLAGVELIQTTQAGVDPQAPINSLLDGITNAAQMAGLSGTEALTTGGIKVDVRPSDTTAIYAALCKSKPPFDNLKVRQAINYAVDREQINQLLYQGTSQPMWAHWTKESAYFNPKLDGYYDVQPQEGQEAAEGGGGREPHLRPHVEQPTPDTTRVGEIIKEQMAEAGITVNLVNTTNIVQDFFTDQKCALGAHPAAARRPRQGHPQPHAGQHRQHLRLRRPEAQRLRREAQGARCGVEGVREDLAGDGRVHRQERAAPAPRSGRLRSTRTTPTRSPRSRTDPTSSDSCGSTPSRRR